MHPLTNKQL
jgi:SNF2 family DNA or RNA helicase